MLIFYLKMDFYCFMFLKPESEVTTFWKEMIDMRVLARFWEHNRERTGNTLDRKHFGFLR